MRGCVESAYISVSHTPWGGIHAIHNRRSQLVCRFDFGGGDARLNSGISRKGMRGIPPRYFFINTVSSSRTSHGRGRMTKL